MSSVTPSEPRESAAAHPPPDQIVLRLLVYLAFAGVVTGCALGAESHAGYWTILVALAAGTLASLAHLLEMLTRRLRTRMSELLGLLAIYAALLVLISNSMTLLSGADGQARSPLIIPVAAALLVLLLRETVVLRCSAHFFPLRLSKTIKLQRRGVILNDELVVPPRWVYIVYWLSPVALWMLGTLLIVSRTLSLDFSPLVLLGILLACVLLVRVLLGIAAWCKAIVAWREARANGDAAARRDAAWFVGFNGLMASGLVLFYVLAVGCNELGNDALRQAETQPNQKIYRELKAMYAAGEPPTQFDRAYNELQKRLYSKIGNDLRLYMWSAPISVVALEKYRGELKPFDAETQWSCAPNPDVYFSDDFNSVDERGMGDLSYFLDLLVANERLAAEDGKWDAVLGNFIATEEVARQCQADFRWYSWEVGTGCESDALTGLLASLLWTEHSTASDEILAKAQERIRHYADMRKPNLIRHARTEFLTNVLLPQKRNLGMRRPQFSWSMVDIALPNILQFKSVQEWRARNRTVELADEVLRAYENGYIEIHRHALLDRMRPFGDNCTTSNITVASFEKELNSELEIICEYRMADAAIAVARYKRKYQYWPKDLQDCVPEFLPWVPADSFNPKSPLQFAVNPARIYSQGTATGYHPERHGQIPFTSRELMNRVFDADNLVLFLGSPEFFRKLPDYAMDNRPGVDIPGEIKNLSSSNAHEHRDALRRLAYVGVKAAAGADALVARLSDPDKEQRMFAAYILGQIGVKSDAVLSALRWARADPDADVRFFAKQALRRLDE